MSEKGRNIDWELAARILNGEADEIDQGLLNQWLNADDSNQEEWENLKEAWNKGGESLLMADIDTDAAWNKVQHFTREESGGMHSQRSRFSPVRALAMAASVIVLLGLSWFFLINSPGEKSSLIVSNTTREEMVLSDGSRVTLNNHSRFSCEQPFREEERIVKLDGEGFFNVEGNKERPFIIHTGEVTIRVTGTSFNVRAYPNLDITEVAVLEGRVEVVPASSDEMVVLTQGQTAFFDRSSRMLTVKETTDPNLLSWITGQIKFDETSLGDVAETLERVYDVNIQLADEQLAGQKLTARFSDNSLDFVLDVVCTTFNMEARREGETIFLSAASGK